MEELCDHICKGKLEKISSRYSEELWNMIKMLLEVDVEKRADCNTFLNSKFVKDIIDDFINDIHEIVSLRRWLWEEKLVSTRTPAQGFKSNHFETDDKAKDYEHKEIYSYVRKLLEKFVEKWSKYFDKLSINED